MKTKIDKWTTIQNWVDLETGETLTENEAKQNYRIIKKQKNAKIHKRMEWLGNNGEWKYYGTLTITNECRKNESKQQTIW